MDVFLFYIAGFSKNGAGLVLEVICLGDLLVDLFTVWVKRAYDKLMAKLTAMPVFSIHKPESTHQARSSFKQMHI